MDLFAGTLREGSQCLMFNVLMFNVLKKKKKKSSQLQGKYPKPKQIPLKMTANSGDVIT